jgi:hypothetical protein
MTANTWARPGLNVTRAAPQCERSAISRAGVGSAQTEPPAFSQGVRLQRGYCSRHTTARPAVPVQPCTQRCQDLRPVTHTVIVNPQCSWSTTSNLRPDADGTASTYSAPSLLACLEAQATNGNLGIVDFKCRLSAVTPDRTAGRRGGR